MEGTGYIEQIETTFLFFSYFFHHFKADGEEEKIKQSPRVFYIILTYSHIIIIVMIVKSQGNKIH